MWPRIYGMHKIQAIGATTSTNSIFQLDLVFVVVVFKRIAAVVIESKNHNRF
jgi:hypothetical protein